MAKSGDDMRNADDSDEPRGHETYLSMWYLVKRRCAGYGLDSRDKLPAFLSTQTDQRGDPPRILFIFHITCLHAHPSENGHSRRVF
jgi:hypothetical protein